MSRDLELEYYRKLAELFTECARSEFKATITETKDGKKISVPLLFYVARRRYQRVRMNKTISNYNFEVIMQILTTISTIFTTGRERESIDAWDGIRNLLLRKFMCPRAIE
jgi:hypothetical protein